VLRLTLIRHGNAEWKDASIADFDRPLNKRGLSEAEGIAKVLLENDLVPELLLTSTAKRTQQTAEILGRVMELPTRRVKFAEQLYLARAEVILTLAQSTGPKVKHLAVVGHNPGISELARELAPADAHCGAGYRFGVHAHLCSEYVGRARAARRSCVSLRSAGEAVQPVHLGISDFSALKKKIVIFFMNLQMQPGRQHSGTFTASPPCDVSL